MSTTTLTSAEHNGHAWGLRARDWSETEAQMRSSYELAIKRAGLRAGQTVLDAGCGSGAFLRAAADHGALVSGIDASEALLAIARERVPDAHLTLGDLQHLPYADDTFDAVTGFCSFFFADDMVEALREAGRVAKPGAPVVIQVWGPHERNDLEAVKAMMRPYFPPRPADAPPEPDYSLPGRLEELAMRSGLTPERSFDTSWAYEYEDDETLGRAMLAPGGIATLVGPEREPDVKRAIVEELAPYRTSEGGYRLQNEYHYLIARA